MWFCKCCKTWLASKESIESHLYLNHLMPRFGKFDLFSCGDCNFKAEGFDGIAGHCVENGHKPTSVTRERDYDEYVCLMLTILEDIMDLDEASDAMDLETTNQGQLDLSSIISDHIDWSNSAVADRGNSAKRSARIIESSLKIPPAINEPDNGIDGKVETTVSGKVIKVEPPDVIEVPEPNQTAQIVRRQYKSGETLPEQTRIRGTPIEPTTNHYKPSITFKKLVFDAETETPMQKANQFRVKSAYCQIRVPPINSQTGRSNERKTKSVREYSCGLCGKKFRAVSFLKLHSSRVHSDERPYSCEMCAKTFKDKYGLKYHEQTIHLKIHRYSCTECNYSAYFKSTLKQHIRSSHRSNSDNVDVLND